MIKKLNLLVLVILFTILGTGVCYAGDKIYINTLQDLIKFRDEVNSGNSFRGKKVILNRDIDVTGRVWEPIGTLRDVERDDTDISSCFEDGVVKSQKPQNIFDGTFEGNHRAIFGLSIDKEDERYVGFF